MGRASIFRQKTGGRVQGELTVRGRTLFEQHREQLAKIVTRESKKVSDADTIEFIVRGLNETVIHLKS